MHHITPSSQFVASFLLLSINRLLITSLVISTLFFFVISGILMFIIYCALYFPSYLHVLFSRADKGRWEVRGGGVVHFCCSNHFALWLLSNSIFCQLASHTPTLKRTHTRTIYTVFSITHASTRAGSTYLRPHMHTHARNNCFCFALYLAGVQVIRPSREIFLIHSESICLHSLCAFARPSLGTHRSTKMPPLSL